MSQAKQTLDAATRMVTAFRTFDELAGDMARTGYFPTLRLDAYRGKHRDACRLLRETMEVETPEMPGLRVPAQPSWGGNWRDLIKLVG